MFTAWYGLGLQIKRSALRLLLSVTYVIDTVLWSRQWTRYSAPISVYGDCWTRNGVPFHPFPILQITSLLSHRTSEFLIIVAFRREGEGGGGQGEIIYYCRILHINMCYFVLYKLGHCACSTVWCHFTAGVTNRRSRYKRVVPPSGKSNDAMILQTFQSR